MKDKKIIKPVVKDGERLEGYYIDNFGTVYSMKSGILTELSKQYRPRDAASPYPYVKLCHKGKPITCMVHRLVCEAFVDVPLPKELSGIDLDRIPQPERNVIIDYVTHPNRYQVNHIDHDPNNYNASNLEWVTPKENQRKYQESRKIKKEILEEKKVSNRRMPDEMTITTVFMETEIKRMFCSSCQAFHSVSNFYVNSNGTFKNMCISCWKQHNGRKKVFDTTQQFDLWGDPLPPPKQHPRRPNHPSFAPS